MAWKGQNSKMTWLNKKEKKKVAHDFLKRLFLQMQRNNLSIPGFKIVLLVWVNACKVMDKKYIDFALRWSSIGKDLLPTGLSRLNSKKNIYF